MAPHPLERERLTGAVQGRVRMWSRTLVLQVQVVIEQASSWSQILSPRVSGTPLSEVEWEQQQIAYAAAAWKTARTIWRDATWEDQLELQRLDRRRRVAAATAAASRDTDPAFAPTQPDFAMPRRRRTDR